MSETRSDVIPLTIDPHIGGASRIRNFLVGSVMIDKIVADLPDDQRISMTKAELAQLLGQAFWRGTEVGKHLTVEKLKSGATEPSGNVIND